MSSKYSPINRRGIRTQIHKCFGITQLPNLV